MEVKNTFIDVPSTPMVGMQASLATAPAQYSAGFSMKESLAQAAGSGASPAPEVLSESSLVKLNTSRPRRAKPMELAFMSTQSMMSIAETPRADPTQSMMLMQLEQPTGVRKATVISGGLSSIPPTPAGLVNWGVTPTGTPYAGSTMLPMPVSAPAVTMTSSASTSTITMAAPAAAARWADALPTPKGAPVITSRQTLSLSGMIQSPKADEKAGLLASALNQMYAAPAVQSVSVMMPKAPPSAPPKMAPTLTGSMILGPPVNAPNFAAPPLNAPFSAAAPQAPAMVQRGTAPGTSRGGSQGSAAALLGLLGAPAVAPQVAVGTLRTAGPTPVKPAAVQVLPAATYAQPVQSSSIKFPSQIIPPPPMCSPKISRAPMMMSAAAPAAPAPTSLESDMQVLLNMALASGNQQAVDALQRQAQQSGISVDAFNAMKTVAPQ